MVREAEGVFRFLRPKSQVNALYGFRCYFRVYAAFPFSSLALCKVFLFAISSSNAALREMTVNDGEYVVDAATGSKCTVSSWASGDD